MFDIVFCIIVNMLLLHHKDLVQLETKDKLIILFIVDCIILLIIYAVTNLVR